jgi:hypothetical protein
VPENYRGEVAKRVVKNMKIRSADSTISNFQLDFVVSTSRLFHVPYVDVPFATRVFDKSFHLDRSLNGYQHKTRGNLLLQSTTLTLARAWLLTLRL